MHTTKHYHKYQKFKLRSGKVLWRCMHPECRHLFYGDELIAGREAQCWLCDEPFTIRDYDLKSIQVRPVCDACRKTRNDKYPGRFGRYPKEKEQVATRNAEMAKFLEDLAAKRIAKKAG